MSSSGPELGWDRCCGNSHFSRFAAAAEWLGAGLGWSCGVCVSTHFFDDQFLEISGGHFKTLITNYLLSLSIQPPTFYYL